MRFANQVLLGSLVAAGLLAGLQYWVANASSPADGQSLTRPLPTDAAAGSRRVLEDLQGVAAGFDLAVVAEDLPAGMAPVLAIGPDGAIRIVVPAPLSRVPGRNVWPGLGILLPRAHLGEVGGSARASLLAIWTSLAAEQPIDRAAIRLHGCQARPGEVERLLRWLR